MTERDAFEVRFGAAVRGYAGRVSTELDHIKLAHRIATREPRRHGFASTLRWRAVAMPRRTWVLLLLAALLTALVAGMLIAGSQPAPKLPPVGPAFACPPGSTPDQPGPVDQARPPSGGSMAFDRAFGKVVLVTPGALGAETWVFDVCTNTWTQMHPKQEPDVAWLGMLAFDTAAGQTISVSNPGGVWAYDLASDAWTIRAGAPPTSHLRLAYDSVAARVVALQVGSPRRLWSFDGVAGVWQPVAQDQRDVWPVPSDSDLHILLAYDASVDRLVGYDRGEVRLFDLSTETWSAPGTRSPPFGYGGYFSLGGEIAYDEAAQQTVLFSLGHVIAYDAAADRWETLYGTDSIIPAECGVRPECRSQPSMVYDPINERLVVYGGNVQTAPDWWGPSEDVLAFDTRTREWTVLLEPTEGQLAP